MADTYDPDRHHHHHVDRHTVVYHSHSPDYRHGFRVQETDSLGFTTSSMWMQHADECTLRTCPLRRYDG